MQNLRSTRDVLLCVSGLAPQVITETLYGLAVQRIPPFIPEEIHLVNTREGAERARLTLLDPAEGHFYRLCADYGLDAGQVAFGPRSIHVIRDAAGNPLDDIRSPEDNEAAADLIVNIVRTLTGAPEQRLHASIAGGRKTMGYYLGYALSLFGREQDELSHVLVSPPFEGHYLDFGVKPCLLRKSAYRGDWKPILRRASGVFPESGQQLGQQPCTGCFTRTSAGRAHTPARAGRRDRQRNLPRQRWHVP